MINKSTNDIREELFTFIETKQDEYIKKGYLPSKINLNRGVIRGLLEVFIYGIWQLYNMLDKLILQATPITSTGDWLKLHCEQIGVYPKMQSKAIGLVEFFRDDENKSNIKIEKNKIVGTLPDGAGNRYRYIVIDDTILSQDTASVLVKVISEDYGEKMNATVGQITEIITPISGIDRVYNNANWLISEAIDDEADSSLIERYTAQWQRITGVTSSAYKSVALSVQGVKSVTINTEHPRGQGTIDIYVLGSAGIPTALLLENVSKAIEKEIIINDDVLVTSPTIKDIDIDLELEVLNGSLDEIKAEAINRLRTYFETVQIGEDISRNRLVSKVITITGVKDITFIKPVELSNIIANNELARLNSLVVNAHYVSEA